MTFGQSVRTCFRKYVTFSGRAPRSEYWWFVLFVILGGIVLSIVDSILFGTGTVETGPGSVTASSKNGPISGLFSLVILLPMLAVGWRRMHDTGRSGLYLLYPILVWVGIGTFASMVGATGPLLVGNFDAFTGIVGLIMIVSVIIAIFSPLIVIWWLTRPTQPKENQWGLPPARPE